jgi:hypothetical protein
LVYLTTAATASWIYAILLVVTFFAVCEDVNRDQGFVILLVVLLIWISGLYSKSQGWFNYLGVLHRFFAGLQMSMEEGLPIFISTILSVWLFVRLILVYFNNRWRVTHKAFEHIMVGRSENKILHYDSSIKYNFRDILKFVLGFGAGSIDIYERHEGHDRLIQPIPNVWKLAWKIRRINVFVETLGVTEEPDQIQPEERREEPVEEKVAVEVEEEKKEKEASVS